MLKRKKYQTQILKLKKMNNVDTTKDEEVNKKEFREEVKSSYGIKNTEFKKL